MNPVFSKILIAMLLAIAGALYSIVLKILGGSLTGGGHGTYFLFELSMSPFDAGFIFWSCIGAIVTYASSRVAAVVMVLMLMMHYISVAIWWLNAEFPLDGLAASWKSLPFLFILNVLIYCSGQILIWHHLVRSWFVSFKPHNL